ncbi:MAG: DUF2214 family protein [Phycisphaerae bacterium]|nr:DUF2214 family protein [Gemmatimonadaceae bacterium]
MAIGRGRQSGALSEAYAGAVPDMVIVAPSGASATAVQTTSGMENRKEVSYPSRMLRIALAALHLLALGIGFGAVWARATALSQNPIDRRAARRAMQADLWWGIAALLWMATGFWRLLAGTEKASAYYMQNHVFFAKMGLFMLIFALEIWPMVTLSKWRGLDKKLGDAWEPDAKQAARIRAISMLEATILIAMIVAAVMMARGFGA